MTDPLEQLRVLSRYIFSNYRSMRNSIEDRLTDRTNKSVFSDIYKNNKWGSDSERHLLFYSGLGSHDPEIVEKYLRSMQHFAERFPHKLDAVDLGCGDFNIGAQTRYLFGNYTACDVVPELIDHNKSKFCDLDVDFKCLDFTSEGIPIGDIIIVRQVLQHLSNRKIMNFTHALRNFKHAIITEHVPNGKFISNLDMKTNGNVRLYIGSGIVLTDPPFNLQVKTSEILCEVHKFGGVIRTIAYEL